MPGNDPKSNLVPKSEGLSAPKQTGQDTPAVFPVPERSTSISLLFALHRSVDDARWVMTEANRQIREVPKGAKIHLWQELMIPEGLPQEFDSFIAFLETNGLYNCPEQPSVVDLLAVTDPKRMSPEFRTKLEALYASQAAYSREDATKHHLISTSRARKAYASIRPEDETYTFPEFDFGIMDAFQRLRMRKVPVEIKPERAPFEAYMAHIESRFHGVMAETLLKSGDVETALRTLAASYILKRECDHIRDSKIATDLVAFSTANPQDVNILSFGIFHSQHLAQEFTSRGVSPRITVQPRTAPISLIEDPTAYDELQLENNGQLSPYNRQLMIRGLMRTYLEMVVPTGKTRQAFVQMTSDIIASLSPESLNDWLEETGSGISKGAQAKQIGTATHLWLKIMAPDELRDAYSALPI
jgi:hypothetical protein